MKYGKKLIACLAALVFALSAFALSACRTQEGSDSSGGASSGGVQMTEEELEKSLLQSLTPDKICGLRATRHEKLWQDGRDYSDFCSETTVAGNEDGVFGVDLYQTERRGICEPGSDAVEWDGPAYVSAAFFRDIDFYGGDLGEIYTVSETGLAETDLMQENIAALQEYIADGKEDVLFRRESATAEFKPFAGETRQDFLAACGLVADAFGQIFALFDGEAAVTDGGYTLTYSLRDCAEELYEGMIKNFLRKMDDDPDMTWTEFAELSQIIALSDRLFADASAEEMHVFLRVVIKAFLTWGAGCPADKIEAADLNAVLPVPGKTQSGASYLRACLASLPEIMEEVMKIVGDPGAMFTLTPYEAVSSAVRDFLYMLGSGSGATEGSLEGRFVSCIEGLSVFWEKYGKEAALALCFDGEKRLTRVDLCIDFDAGEASDTPEALRWNLSYRLDFFYESPALFDLAEYRCITGEKLVDKGYKGEIELTGYDFETSVPVGGALGVDISVADGGERMTIALSDDGAVIWTGDISVSDLSNGILMSEFTWRGERFNVRAGARGIFRTILPGIIDRLPVVGDFGQILCTYLGILQTSFSVESVYLEIEQIDWAAAGADYAPATLEVAWETELITEFIR